MKVTVHLKEQSKPIVYKKVRNTYQKGGFFCVMLKGGTIVHKFPMADIFRVTDDTSGK